LAEIEPARIQLGQCRNQFRRGPSLERGEPLDLVQQFGIGELRFTRDLIPHAPL
jgi:hypothetical protein